MLCPGFPWPFDNRDVMRAQYTLFLPVLTESLKIIRVSFTVDFSAQNKFVFFGFWFVCFLLFFFFFFFFFCFFFCFCFCFVVYDRFSAKILDISNVSGALNTCRNRMEIYSTTIIIYSYIITILTL